MSWTAARLSAQAIADHGRNREKIAEAVGFGPAKASHVLVPRYPAAPMPSDVADATRTEDWLLRLMGCGGWSGRRLHPEEELSAWTAAELRRLTRAGRLPGVVWTCHRVELPVGGKIGRMLQALFHFLGVIPGSSDYVLTRRDGALWIELKVEAAQGDMIRAGRRRTYLRPIQKDFREWCVRSGIPHETCRSVPEVLDALRRRGWLL